MVVAMDPQHVEKNLAVIARSEIEALAIGTVVPRGSGAAVRYTGALKL